MLLHRHAAGYGIDSGEGKPEAQGIAAGPVVAERDRAAASPRPPVRIIHVGMEPCQATDLIFSAASAKRFCSGLATSPASFSVASVEREASLTIASNAPRQ